jgi:hypothetical protein
VTVALDSGQLVLTPTEATVWLNDETSRFVYKEIQGDFMVTAAVQATADGFNAPGPGYLLAGLMMRNGTSAFENWAAILVGSDADSAPIIETKPTVNGSSSPDSYGWAATEAELRLCIVDGEVSAYVREAGGNAWTEQAFMVPPPQLPETVQVGMITYAYDPMTDPPEMIGDFDWIRFASVGGQGDCTAE